MTPGTQLQEGVVVSHDEKRGVFVGREAENDRETCPARHTEHNVGGRRVFLSNDQAPIPPAALHPKRVAKK